jgi:hypothetical protein
MSQPVILSFDAEAPAPGEAFLMPTPEGVLQACSQPAPGPLAQAVQGLLRQRLALRENDWASLGGSADDLHTGLARHWIHRLPRQLAAPDGRLERFLPSVMAGLSGRREAVLASDQGFCIASVGYDDDEAETLSVAAADFFEFLRRQRARGWTAGGQVASFFQHADALLPSASLVPLWIDGNGYGLVVGGEPLINNLALVELVWSLQVAGDRYRRGP